MKIVLSVTNFASLTGSELYVYELARVLAKRNHKVTILATSIDGEIAAQSHANGVKMYSFFNHPDIKPDIVHSSQFKPTAYSLRHFPNAKHFVTVHSPLSYEKPIYHDKVKTYICVRPEIVDKVQEDPRFLGKTRMIWNGVDFHRFNMLKTGDENPNSILFVGTMDHLRKNMVEFLMKYAQEEKKELIIVSDAIKEFRLDEEKNIRYYPARWDIEGLTKYAGVTTSIYIGRTTIEGWACGKPGWVFEVDEKGQSKKAELMAVPKNMLQFDIEYMTDRVLETYEQ